jgi:hypothetical protein
MVALEIIKIQITTISHGKKDRSIVTNSIKKINQSY